MSPLPELAPGPPAALPPTTITKVVPLAPQRFALQVTIDQATQEKLTRAQALLRHRVPSGELAHVLEHALDALLATLMQTKFGAAARPRTGKRRTATRYVPSEVKRAVHARDGEQCTFVSEAGDRCGERGLMGRSRHGAVSGIPILRSTDYRRCAATVSTTAAITSSTSASVMRL
jgi:hypothetical protein